MSTKHDSKCLANAGDDEPIFVLRAQDEFAADLVVLWASRFRNAHFRPIIFVDRMTEYEWDTPASQEKYESAIKVWHQMLNFEKTKVPD